MIKKYHQNEMNALALIHNLAQVFQFKLELKETVTPGKGCKSKPENIAKVLEIAYFHGFLGITGCFVVSSCVRFFQKTCTGFTLLSVP